jgi:hypothetical protein
MTFLIFPSYQTKWLFILNPNSSTSVARRNTIIPTCHCFNKMTMGVTKIHANCEHLLLVKDCHTLYFTSPSNDGSHQFLLSTTLESEPDVLCTLCHCNSYSTSLVSCTETCGWFSSSSHTFQFRLFHRHHNKKILLPPVLIIRKNWLFRFIE